jgi:hypothetical protein
LAEELEDLEELQEELEEDELRRRSWRSRSLGEELEEK